MRRIFLYLILMMWIIPAGGQGSHACLVHNLTTIDYQNQLNDKWLSDYDVKFYDIRLSVSNTSTIISGSAAVLLEAVRSMDTLVLELQDSLEVTKIGIYENADSTGYVELFNFLHSENALFIPLDRIRSEGERFFISIEYNGDAGQDNGFFSGVTSSKDFNSGFEVTYTLSEPHNARDWLPVKQVLEDKIDSACIRLTCADHLMAASNGLLENIEMGENNTHTFHWYTRYPLAYYLLSFAVADYRDFSFNTALSEGGDSVLVQNFIYDSDAVFRVWEDEIRTTGSLITLFSDLLIDYPFKKEKYGHAMAPMGGGMEHQTMTTIQDFSFYLVAHELAHQWFGDYVTCGNWQDIWINEGFASYMEYVAGQVIRGQDTANAWMINAMSIALGESGGSVYVPEEKVEDVYRLFNYGLTYKKGAILLHMIRYQLDDDQLFFRILGTYLEQFGNGLALAADFRNVLETVSDRDFSCFFDQWYYGEGFPRFNIQWYQVGDSLSITSDQTTSSPRITPFFQTPFDLEVRLSDGTAELVRFMQEEPVEEFTVFVDGQVESLLFDPDNWLLKTSTVNRQLPSNGKYSYGPNPVVDELFIQFLNTSLIDEISITSINGQEVLKSFLVENPLKIDLSQLEDGAYVLVIKEAEQTYKERIVKISGK